MFFVLNNRKQKIVFSFPNVFSYFSILKNKKLLLKTVVKQVLNIHNLLPNNCLELDATFSLNLLILT